MCTGYDVAMQGKLDTEDLLDSKSINWTSIRPVYIYGEETAISLHASVYTVSLDILWSRK